MFLSAITTPPQPPQHSPCNTFNTHHVYSYNCNLFFCPNSHKVLLQSYSTATQSPNPKRPRLNPLNFAPSSSVANPSSVQNHLDANSDTHLFPCTHTPYSSHGNGEHQRQQPSPPMLPSASAVVAAIRRASTSPVEFEQFFEKDQKSNRLVLPSHDFQRLCVQQLDLFRRTVDPDAILSVYVRPAGGYVMDRLELRRVASYPGVSAGEVAVLVGQFHIPTGLRAAEAALLNLQVQIIHESKAVVFPLVKHPFVVGFLVAELPMVELPITEGTLSEEPIVSNDSYVGEARSLPPVLEKRLWGIQSLKNEPARIDKFTPEQRSNAINISHTLATAHVLDQKALLLQQSSWQNNVRMSNLVEQIRGPLSSIRTLSKMLSTQMKRSETSYDIVEDILVQGNRLQDTLQQLQDAVYVTKANLVRYNEEALKKMHESPYAHTESEISQSSNNFLTDGSAIENHDLSKQLSLRAAAKDLEMPLPPMTLAPLQHGIRPCNVSEVLADLIEAVRPLAHKQRRSVELSELLSPLHVAVEEPALRQAFSNLIEGALLRTHIGGKVEILCTHAPAGGTLVIIDDDGPDMHYMSQMHSLTSYGADLFSEVRVEDNMTWNFVAGLTVAREILESYGCVVRVISPRITDAALGAGGTRLELWLPSSMVVSDLNGHGHAA